MGLFDSVGDFFDSNKSWLKPVTKFVGNIGGNLLENRNQQNYLDSLRASEDKNYADAKALYDAQVAYANSNSGGGSSGDGGAAARANEAQRVKAAKKGMKLEKKGFQDIRELYQPYVDTGKELLPRMSSTYQQGLDNLGMINAFYNDPTKQNNSKAAYQINVPLPKYLTGRK